MRTIMLLFASRIFQWNGEFELAEVAAREGLDSCEQTDEKFLKAELLRQLGNVRRSVGDEPGAREHFESAIAVAQAQGHLVSEIRTRASRMNEEDRLRLREIDGASSKDFGPWERKLLEDALA